MSPNSHKTVTTTASALVFSILRCLIPSLASCGALKGSLQQFYAWFSSQLKKLIDLLAFFWCRLSFPNYRTNFRCHHHQCQTSTAGCSPVCPSNLSCHLNNSCKSMHPQSQGRGQELNELHHPNILIILSISPPVLVSFLSSFVLDCDLEKWDRTKVKWA